MSAAESPAGGHPLLILPTLETGGQGMRFITLAESLREHAGGATFLAGPGSLRERAAASAEVVDCDWLSGGRGELRALAGELARRHDWVVAGCAPETVDVLPALLATGLHLVLDNVPGTFPEWFGAAGWERLRTLLAAFAASSRVVLSAASSAQAREHERDIGLAPGAVHPWPVGLRPPALRPPIVAGAPHSIGILARLAPEKLPAIAGAARLVAAGRSRRHDVRLEVFGGGDAARVRALLERLLPAHAWTLHGETATPLAALAACDAVVATGRAAVEALMLGRGVVTARPAGGPGAELGAVVTPANLDTAAAHNFNWSRLEPVAADATWAALERLPDSAREALRRRARRRFSAAAHLRTALALAARLEPCAGSLPAT